MSGKMIGILIRKDMRLVSLPVLFYLLAGAVSIGLMAVEGSAWFYAGCVLLISALMALGFHPCMATVISERKDQTLAFVMSMPITPTDYTWAKIAANLLMFFVPWALLTGGTIVMILVRPAIPDGMIPYSTVLFCAIADGALVVLSVALISESLQLAIASQIICNLLFQAVMYGASNMPGIRASMYTETVVWSTPTLLFVGAEIGLGAVLLGVTLWQQSRKTDFI